MMKEANGIMVVISYEDKFLHRVFAYSDRRKAGMQETGPDRLDQSRLGRRGNIKITPVDPQIVSASGQHHLILRARPEIVERSRNTFIELQFLVGGVRGEDA